jgi:hypothetical protein
MIDWLMLNIMWVFELYRGGQFIGGGNWSAASLYWNITYISWYGLYREKVVSLSWESGIVTPLDPYHKTYNSWKVYFSLMNEDGKPSWRTRIRSKLFWWINIIPESQSVILSGAFLLRYSVAGNIDPSTVNRGELTWPRSHDLKEPIGNL